MREPLAWTVKIIMPRSNVLWARGFFRVDALPSGYGGGGGGGGGLRIEVASMRLKIEQQVAYGLALIAMEQFFECQNSYGFGAI